MDIIKFQSEFQISNEMKRDNMNNININKSISMPININSNKITNKTDKLLTHVFQLFKNMSKKSSVKVKYINTKENLAVLKENTKFVLDKDYIVYRIQISSKKEVCCCSCNSDAMFEVMKSLYDCYKKKNCDNCKCVLCGHLPRDYKRDKERTESQGDGVTPKETKQKPKQEKVRKKTKLDEEIIQSKKLEQLPLGEIKTEPVTIVPRSEQKLYRPVEGEKLKEIDTLERMPSVVKTTVADKKITQQEVTPTGLRIRAKKSKEAAEKKLLVQDATTKEQLEKNDAGKIIDESTFKKPIKEASTIKPKVEKPEKIQKEEKKEKKETTKKEKLEKKTKKPEKIKEKKILVDSCICTVPIPPKEKPEPEIKIDDKKQARPMPDKKKPITQPEKEKLLKDARILGLKTPSQGDTASEKKKIRAERAKKAPVEQQKDVRRKALSAGVIKPDMEAKEIIVKEAREAGLTTPSIGKTPSVKEKIRRSRAAKFTDQQRQEIRQAAQAIDVIKPTILTPVEQENVIKEARLAGIVTPSEGDTKSQKEKIRKSRSKKKPLEEKEKIRKKLLAGDISIQKELKPKKEIKGEEKSITAIKPIKKVFTQPEKEKLLKEARILGLKTPSQGDTASEKRKIRAQRAKEASIKQQKEVRRKALSAGVIKPDKEAKEMIAKEAREAGLTTPSIGKTPSAKEKIRRSRAAKFTEQQRQEIHHAAQATKVIKPKTITPVEQEKILKEARMAGIITPSEGDTKSQKEKIRKSRSKRNALEEKEKIRKQLQAGDYAIQKETEKKLTPDKKEKPEKKIRPEIKEKPSKAIKPEKPKTKEKKSEEKIKKSIECICSETMAKSTTSVKPKKAFTKPEKEKLLKDARTLGLKTPSQGDTASEKKKIRAERAKKAPVEQQKDVRRKALSAGVIKPDSEAKDIIVKEAREAGLTTPSIGKTPSVKEKIRRSRAAKFTDQQRQEIRQAAQAIEVIKPVTTTPGEEEKILKEARIAGIITPSEGDTKSQKEKIRKSRSKKKPLEEKEKIRKQLLAGDITVQKELKPEKEIKGKEKSITAIKPTKKAFTQPEKEKLLKEARILGLKTPSQGDTASEKEKIRAQRAKKAPMEQQKEVRRKALSAGVIKPDDEIKEIIVKEAREAGLTTPSIGKTPSVKEKIRRSRAAKFTDQQRQEIRHAAQAIEVIKPVTTPVEEEKILKEARMAGIITPSEGDTKSQKEKIRKSRSKKNALEEKEKIRKQLQAGDYTTQKEIKADKKVKPDKKIKPEKKEKPGKAIKPEKPKTTEKKSKEKNKKSIECICSETIAKSITSVKPKKAFTKPEKEKLLKDARTLGLKTPSQGDTASEKKKIRAERAIKAPVEQQKDVRRKALSAGVIKPDSEAKDIIVKEAREAGLTTPSIGKTPSVKEKIRRSRAAKFTDQQRQEIRQAAQAIELIKPTILTPVEQENILKEARLAGIVTPSEGDTKSQKEKIRKSRSKKKPLEEKEKIRKQLLAGDITIQKELKPEKEIKTIKGKEKSITAIKPTKKAFTQPEKDKLLKEARILGLKTPSQGETPSEKKKIRAQRAKKAPIEQQKEVRRKALSAGVIKPDSEAKEIIVKEAREAGLTTPSIGKTPSIKEKIRRSRAAKFTEKQRQEIRQAAQATEVIKPTTTTPVEKEKILKEARLAGIITPSEGDTKSLKEKIRKSRSKKKPIEEKEKIRKQLQVAEISVQKETKPEKEPISPLLTPIEQKKPKVKPGETIKPEKPPITGIEAKKKEKLKKSKTVECICGEGIKLKIEEKGDIDRIKHSIQMAKALSTHKKPVVKTPSEVKMPSKQEKAPEAKRLTEKELIKQTLQTPAEVKVPSKREEIREAKILTEKERIRQTLQSAGIIAQIEKTTPAEREKIRKMARDVGLLTPSTGKSPSEKVEIQKKRSKKHSLSERELVRQQAQAAGVLPLKKSPSQEKKDMMKQIRKAGLATPSEGNTPSVKENIRTSRFRASSKSRNQKLINAAQDLGLTLIDKPLSSSEKKKIKLEGRAAGLLTPSIGSTDSKKQNIRKIRAKKMSPTEKEQVRKKLQRADVDDVLRKSQIKEKKTVKEKKKEIPSEGIKPKKEKKIEKEKPSDKEKLPEKEKPPDKEKPSDKEKPLDKEKITDKNKREVKDKKIQKKEKKRSECECDISLTKLLKKKSIKETKKITPKEKSKETILKEAREAGLLTPSIGKDEAEKEKIRKRRSSKVKYSDKKRIRKSLKELELQEVKKQPETRKSKEKKEIIVEEARKAGLLTPSIGKTSVEKEKKRKSRASKVKSLEKNRIEKALKDVGIIEEKKRSLIKKELIPKKKITTSSTSVPKRLSEFRIKEKRRESPGMPQTKTSSTSFPKRSAHYKIKGKTPKDISEISQIIPSGEKKSKLPKLKCDQACGCDKRKLKFKHSYVKIKITTPDISSLCPCPDDCLPSIKQADNNGIKVTVGTALILNNNYVDNYQTVPYKYAVDRNYIQTLYVNNITVQAQSSISSTNELLEDTDKLKYYISQENFKQNFISQYIIQQQLFSQRYQLIRSFHTNENSLDLAVGTDYEIYNSKTLFDWNVSSTVFSFISSSISSSVSSTESSSMISSYSTDLEQLSNVNYSKTKTNYSSEESYLGSHSTREDSKFFDSCNIGNHKVNIPNDIADILLKKYVKQIIFPYISHKIKYMAFEYSDSNFDKEIHDEDESAIFIVIPQLSSLALIEQGNLNTEQSVSSSYTLNTNHETQYTQFMAKTMKNVQITGVDNEGRLIYHTIATDTTERPCRCLEGKNQSYNDKSKIKTKRKICHQCTMSHKTTICIDNDDYVCNQSNDKYIDKRVYKKTKKQKCEKCLLPDSSQVDCIKAENKNINTSSLNSKVHCGCDSSATDNIYLQYEDDTDNTKDTNEFNNYDSSATNSSSEQKGGIKLSIPAKGTAARGFLDIPCFEKMSRYCFKNKADVSNS